MEEFPKPKLLKFKKDKNDPEVQMNVKKIRKVPTKVSNKGDFIIIKLNKR
jgi:hypothetical protein